MTYKICPVLILWLAVSHVAAGQDAATETAAETARIETSIQAYLAAFNARDVEKLVSYWSPEGVYVSRTSGDKVVGREQLAEEFAALFANDHVPKLATVTDSIDFLSPNVALERGTSTVTKDDNDVVESDYSVVYVKKDGKWLIDRVTEDVVIAPPHGSQQLKELEWLIGEWVDDGGDISIEFDCQWTRNQTYLSRSYKVASEQDVESSGLQIIGWNPKLKQIQSWLFDSNGGFVTATWTKRGEQWIVQSEATLADGGSGSFTSIFRPLADGNHTLQKINRVVDGRLLPNIDEIVIHRK